MEQNKTHQRNASDAPSTALREPLPTRQPPHAAISPDAKTNVGKDPPTQKSAKEEEKFRAKQAKLQQTQANTQSLQKKEKKPTRSNDVDAYEPDRIEEGRYEWWESRGYFKPELAPDGKVKLAGKFVIPIPPPNVTGSLHMGHALTNALQDIMIRHARMRGKTTLWVPGCDHASISTQSVVEKMLWKTQGKTRHEIGRPQLLNMIWDWTNKYKGNITMQLKRLGGSMDWTREAFTMDANLSEAVRVTFIQLYDEGIIYRANRLVNWCSILSTSLSNLEVDNKELTGRTKLTVPGYTRKIDFGVLTYFKYPIRKSDAPAKVVEKYSDCEFIEIATTRPETMFGDTAIAVHPTDTRYTHLVGRTAIHPFIPDRDILIIVDEEVDPEFGTGAVKITPAHDPVDFLKGKKHSLEFINILNDNGTLNDNAGPQFSGQKRFEARYTVVAALNAKGLYSKEKDHAMVIPLCQRSKDVVEPVLKPQWWMKMTDLAKAADDAVTDGRITIRPESEEKKFHYWMQRTQDWCLSRQLWWGHRVPAYYIKYWVCANDEDEARVRAERNFPGKTFTLHQDEDVLDTWFSSGLWPWATLGWPKKTADLEAFYPTSCLETGWDILFFWVARMIMLGLKMTGKVPFTEVYCYSLIRDSEGRKMSKSLGNVVDPLDIINGNTLAALHAQLTNGNLDSSEIERASAYQRSAFPNGIPRCGADALRFSLINYTTGGGDIAFDIKEIEAKRRFCNKIYQATNYVLRRLGEGFTPTPIQAQTLSLAERWILHRLNSTAKDVTSAIESRNFSLSTLALYQYWLHDFCDIFGEISKPVLVRETDEVERRSVQQTLYTALEGGLLLLHPIMPYLTEYLWQKLPRREGDTTPSIIVAKYPEFETKWDDAHAVKDYELVLAIAEGIRGLLSLYGVKERSDIMIKLLSEDTLKLVQEQLTMITSLAGKYLGRIDLEHSATYSSPPKGYALRTINADITVFLKIGNHIDLSDLTARQQNSLDNARKNLQKTQEIMGCSGWEKANRETQEKEQEKLKTTLSDITQLEVALEELRRLTKEV